MRPLAITGLGVVSSIGVGREAFFGALRYPGAAQERAFGKQPTVLDPAKLPEARAAEVWGFDAEAYLGNKGIRNFDRLTKFLIVAAKHALEDAGMKKDGAFTALSPKAVGICSSTAYGSLDAITELNLVAELEDPRYINPARFPNTVINAAAGYVSIWEDLRAPNVTVVDGNCGALDAVLSCETHLLHRRGDAFLIGGGEVLSEPLYLAFRKLGVVAEGKAPAMPCDPSSKGTHIGEGAAYVVAERLPDARARGARILATIDGYGTAFEPPESEALLVNASADSVERAIAGAVADAGISIDDVDVVCAAASGIELIDRAELEGIQRALGDVAVAAPKALFGETFGASGALGIAAALAWMSGVPPAPLVGMKNEVREVEVVVVTTVGFYGNVSAVVLEKHGARHK